jgi:prephenate dehydratase
MMRKPATVAFQGEAGAFSEAAAYKLLGPAIKTIPCMTFEDMFSLVSQKKVDRAVVPIENSLVGSIHKNYDLLIEHETPIVNEVYLQIVHNLIGHPQAKLSQITRVFSHQVALGQCLQFFKSNPKIKPCTAFDTAGSVKMILSGNDLSEGAIASANAAETYGGKILLRSIEDHKENFTRFLLIAHPSSVRKTKHLDSNTKSKKMQKTSLVYHLKDQPGTLFKSLAVFALRDIDLKKIESRPILGRPWEYVFYVDIIGSQGDPLIKKALEHLAEFAESVRILGSYPVGLTQR